MKCCRLLAPLLKHFLKYALLVTALLFLGGFTSLSKANSAKVRISARVLPYCSARIHPLSIQVNITEKDIQRGWIDTTEAFSISIKTNHQNGGDFSFFDSGVGQVLVKNRNHSSYSNTINIPSCQKIGQWCPDSALDLRLMTGDLKETGIRNIPILPEWTNCNL